jgi:hypothetical protein
MVSQEAASSGADPIVPAAPQETRPAGAAWPGKLLNWVLILGLAMLAGVGAWVAGESTSVYFQPSPAAAANYRDSRALNLEMPGVNARNGALTFGVLGGLLGLALGLAGGFCRRSPDGALMGAIAGLILGAAVGALPSFLVMPWQWRHRNDDPATLSLLVPLLIHLGLWSGVGLGAGLAFGIGSGGFRPARLIESALAGLVGAMLGTFVFEMVGAILFPLDHTASPFSATSTTRLLARLCVAGFVGLAAIRSLPSSPVRNDPRGG